MGHHLYIVLEKNMNVYAVIRLSKGDGNDNTVGNILRGLGPSGSVYEQYASSGVYFIRFAGTARQLSERIDFGNKDRPAHGIVIEASQYFGFATKDLWTWMDSS